MSASVEALRHPLLEWPAVPHGFGVRGAPEPQGALRPQQVHGRDVVRAEQLAAGERPRADAIVSTRPGLPIAVVTADCVPILVAACGGRAVAAIHAGWRGLAAGVLEAGLDMLGEAVPGGSACAAEWIAVIGPHIGPCCYEVDEPVLDALASRYSGELARCLRPSRPGHAFLDLGELARGTLLRAGLRFVNVGEIPGACTRCDAERFHSFRRDGAAAGRLLHFIAARAEAPEQG